MRVIQTITALLCVVGYVASQFPGPNFVVARPGTGYTEVWLGFTAPGANAIPYAVRDFNQQFVQGGPTSPRLRPTLVYNCAYMKALCANVRAYVAQARWTLPVTLHYDKDVRNGKKGVRSTARRSSTCASNWIRQSVNGRNRCPEVAQPTYMTSKLPWQNVEMYKEDKGGILVDSLNYLGRKKRDRNTGKDVWSLNGVMLTCDEWPAASWIEGGSGGGATTICAPQNGSCGKAKGYGAGQTEQDWQAYGHKNLGSWFKRNTPLGAARNPGNPDWTIYKFNFDLRTDNSVNAPAVWVEADGRRRYCTGPNGARGYGCSP